MTLIIDQPAKFCPRVGHNRDHAQRLRVNVGGMDKQLIPPPDASGTIERWISAPVGLQPCPFTSLKHGKFYLEFGDNPEVRQVRTGIGAKRGKRLFWLPDIYAFLERKGREQQKGAV